MPQKTSSRVDSLIKLHSDTIHRLNNMGLAEVYGVVFPTNKHAIQTRLREKLAKRKQQKNN
jgi:hypothetical protein